MKSLLSFIVVIATLLVSSCTEKNESITGSTAVENDQVAAVVKSNKTYDKKIYDLKSLGLKSEDIKTNLQSILPKAEANLPANKPGPLTSVKKTKVSNLVSKNEGSGLGKCLAYNSIYKYHYSTTFTPKVIYENSIYLNQGQTLKAYTLTGASSAADPYIIVISNNSGDYYELSGFTINSYNDDAQGAMGGKWTDSYLSFLAPSSNSYTVLVCAYDYWAEGTSNLIIKVNDAIVSNSNISVVGQTVRYWNGGNANWVFTTNPYTVTGSEDPIITVFNFATMKGCSNDDFNYYWKYCMDLGAGPCGQTQGTGHSSFLTGIYDSPQYIPADGNGYAASICTSQLSCYNVPNMSLQQGNGFVLLWGAVDGGSVDYYQYGAQ